MIIKSDWHIHSEHSYDATTPLEVIGSEATAQGLVRFGITDHLNLNDESFKGDLSASAAGVAEAKKKYPVMTLGVELTPIAKPEFDYIAKFGTREGYIAPVQPEPYGIELAMTREELMARGVRYAIGASHWRVDEAGVTKDDVQLDKCIREWYRQQMMMAEDDRVTVLGHPWYHGKGAWYEDFTLIPRSMNMDIAEALKRNKKYVECNAHFFTNRMVTEKFRRQYADFLRELFEMGIPITYGSDSHCGYGDHRAAVEKYLAAAGFGEGDFSEIAEADLW